MGKQSIANLSDKKLTEVFVYQFFAKSTSFKRWQFFVIGIAIITLGGSFFVAKGLVSIQELLFNTSNGYFIGHDIYLFVIVVMGLGFGGIVIMVLYFARNTPDIPYDKWESYPEITTIHKRIKGLRNTGFLISLGLQIAFLFGMMDYTIIEEDKVIRNPLGSFTAETIDVSKVQKAELTYDYRTETSTRSSKTREVLDPQFNIEYNDNAFNIWYQTMDLSDSIIEKIAKRLYYNKVEIKVNYPGIMEKSKWRKTYKPEKFNQVMRVYDYVSMMVDGVAEPIKSGNKVRAKHLEIQLDSARFGSQYNIFKSSGDEPLLVYFTVKNQGIDTTYFGTLLSLHAIDENNEEYNISSFIKDFGDAAIPPQSTVYLMRGFDISKSEKKGLKIRYRPSVLNEQYIYFELE